MRWALAVRDAARTSCCGADRCRHGQHKWRWVAVKGICASKSLTLQEYYLAHVSSKERMRFSRPFCPLCSGRRARSVPGGPVCPHRRSALVPGGLRVSCKRARGRHGRVGPQHVIAWRPVYSEIKHSPAKLLQFRLLRLSYALRVQEDRKMSTTLQLLPACI